MKYISQYFPFVILTLFLYGLLFHFHNQSTLIPPLPVNSGQQAMQLQFTEVAEPLADEQQPQADEQQHEPGSTATPVVEPKPQPSSAPVTAEQPQIPENDSKPQRQEPPVPEPVEQTNSAQPGANNAEPSQPVTPTETQPITAQPIAAQQLPSEPVETPVTSSEAAAVQQPVDSETSNQAPVAQQPVEAKSSSEALAIAKQKLYQSIENTKASEDARLKAELFAAEFNLVSASVDTDPTPIEIVKAAKRPLAPVEKPNDNPQPVATKKAVVVKPDNSKAVFKKQPSATSNTQNQGVLQEAIVVSGNTPIYPQRAILRNQQGRVVVKLTVTMKGQAKDPEIITSSGYDILDNAILDFIQQELFMPAHKGEEKVTSEQIFAFRFELK